MAESPSATLRLWRWLGKALEAVRWGLAAVYLLGTSVFMAWMVVEARGLSRGTTFLGIIDIGSMSCQCLLIFGSGLRRLDSPLPARRLWMPVLATAVALSFTATGLGLGLTELIAPRGGSDWVGVIFWLVLGAWFLAACVVLWCWGRGWSRLRVLSRFSLVALGAGVVEVGACVGIFMVTSQREEFFAGILAAFGVGMGVVVVHFALGPAIVALFLRPVLRREQEEAARYGGSTQP